MFSSNDLIFGPTQFLLSCSTCLPEVGFLPVEAAIPLRLSLTLLTQDMDPKEAVLTTACIPGVLPVNQVVYVSV